MSSFAVASTFTPVLNTSNFASVFGGEDGISLPLDNQGLLRAVETIAYPETKFRILKQIHEQCVQVETEEYPCTPLFVDTRFLTPVNEKKSERKKHIPPASQILTHMQKLIGTPYIWGGNYSKGIPQLLAFYPPKTTLQENKQVIWTLKGVDCSGLLYEATQGFTPRNTAWLLHFGKPVAIENLHNNQICALVKPLDLIVWQGHVIMILDSSTSIESRGGVGVITSNLLDRLNEITTTLKRTPANSPKSDSSYFIIRRWHSEFI